MAEQISSAKAEARTVRIAPRKAPGSRGSGRRPRRRCGRQRGRHAG